MQFRYWKSVKNSWWYWHFVDRYGAIRTVAGQGFRTGPDAVKDINEVFILWGGTVQCRFSVSRDHFFLTNMGPLRVPGKRAGRCHHADGCIIAHSWSWASGAGDKTLPRR